MASTLKQPQHEKIAPLPVGIGLPWLALVLFICQKIGCQTTGSTQTDLCSQRIAADTNEMQPLPYCAGWQKEAFCNLRCGEADIDSMIRRVNLNPGVKGFMPFKKTEKIPDSLIAVFVKWKADGMLEK